jgi:Kef-type K+ transport system membrane component KefB
MESGSRGRFKDLLLAIVAIDDAWALILFGLGVAIATSTGDTSTQTRPLLLGVLRDIGGGVALGVVPGLPAATLSGRLKPGQPILSEALGLVLLCGGLALWLEASVLITAMKMGGLIANPARHHECPLHAIENIEWPSMVVFFVLAGATLEPGALVQVGLFGVVYIVCRVHGEYAGSALAR